MLQVRQPTDDLKNALSCLEEQVTIPVVPGELCSWCQAVGESLSPLGSVWKESCRRRRGLLRQMLREDSDSVCRVEQLKSKARRLGCSLRRFARSLGQLLESNALSPLESRESDQEAEALRQDLLEWIVGCRTLEKEVETWFIEALYRDRGTGD